VPNTIGFQPQRGIAKFFANGKDIDVRPGSLIYVKSHEKHRFHWIEEDLTVLVMFSTAKPQTK
jgi:quercetin dioxygenase-like cupin family protein